MVSVVKRYLQKQCIHSWNDMNESICVFVNHYGLKYGSSTSLTAIVEVMRDIIKSGVERVTLTIDDYGGSGDEAWRRGALAGYNKDNKIICRAK